MQWYIYLITIATPAFLLKFAAELLRGPIETAFYLRRESLAQIISFRNMSLPRPRELAITSQEIRDYDRAVQNLRNAQQTFADLGARFLVLSENEPTIRNLMMMFGLDMKRAGNKLIGLAQIYAAIRTDASGGRNEIEQALQSANVALKVSRCQSRDTLTKIRLEPMCPRHGSSLYRRRDRQTGELHDTSLRHRQPRRQQVNQTQ